MWSRTALHLHRVIGWTDTAASRSPCINRNIFVRSVVTSLKFASKQVTTAYYTADRIKIKFNVPSNIPHCLSLAYSRYDVQRSTISGKPSLYLSSAVWNTTSKCTKWNLTHAAVRKKRPWQKCNFLAASYIHWVKKHGNVYLCIT